MNEVLREEKKFLMTLESVIHLSNKLGAVMKQDSHSKNGGYRVRSLYFDTINDTDYFDKLDGLERRRKIRLRIYDPADDFAMLEMKQKEGCYQKKRSLRIARADAKELAEGNYGSLLRYPDSFATECYALMNMRCYRPKAVVEYKRTAFIAEENRIRVTMDRQIIATESNMNLFDPNLNMYPVFDSFNAVMEVKYNGFMLSYIKDLINAANRSELTVSKYCLARSAGLHFGF